MPPACFVRPKMKKKIKFLFEVKRNEIRIKKNKSGSFIFHKKNITRLSPTKIIYIVYTYFLDLVNLLRQNSNEGVVREVLDCQRTEENVCE